MRLLILLLIPTLLTAQRRIQDTLPSGEPTMLIVPNEAMVYYTYDKEMVATSIVIDSSVSGEIKVRLYVYFESPRLFEYYLRVATDKSKPIYLSPSYSDLNDGYFEYELTKEVVTILRTERLIDLLFVCKESGISCVPIKYGRYYMDFLNKYLNKY